MERGSHPPPQGYCRRPSPLWALICLNGPLFQSNYQSLLWFEVSPPPFSFPQTPSLAEAGTLTICADSFHLGISCRGHLLLGKGVTGKRREQRGTSCFSRLEHTCRLCGCTWLSCPPTPGISARGLPSCHAGTPWAVQIQHAVRREGESPASSGGWWSCWAGTGFLPLEISGQAENLPERHRLTHDRAHSWKATSHCELPSSARRTIHYVTEQGLSMMWERWCYL